MSKATLLTPGDVVYSTRVAMPPLLKARQLVRDTSGLGGLLGVYPDPRTDATILFFGAPDEVLAAVRELVRRGWAPDRTVMRWSVAADGIPEYDGLYGACV